MTEKTTFDSGADPPELTVTVIVARERIDHPWQEYAWRPLEVLAPAPAIDAWTIVRETASATHFVAGMANIELHRTEAAGYLENLAGGLPVLYVVLRPADDAAHPLQLHLVTASPTEVQAYGHSGDEIIGTVAMPQAVAERVLEFAALHHDPKPFVKRVRAPHSRPETHAFGQEPIVELRRRMGGPDKQGGDDGPRG